MVTDTFSARRPERRLSAFSKKVSVTFLKEMMSSALLPSFRPKRSGEPESIFQPTRGAEWVQSWRALARCLGAAKKVSVTFLAPWIGAVLLLAPAAPAAAEYRASAQLRLTSDYVYRRYSKSADHPTAQLNVNLSESRGAFLGAWLSYVEIDEARLEANPYAGVGIDLAPRWRLDAVAEGYLYDGEIRRWTPHYAQLYTALRYDEWLTARLAYAFDAYGSGEDILDGELSARYPVTDVLELGAAIGYEHFPDETDYGGAYGSAGVTYYPGRHVAVGLRYHAAEHTEGERRGRYTDLSIVPNPVESRVEFSISVAW
jgi:uncharacterized protein (TIGR02001 family)